MRLGVLAGTFDPIHLGHLNAATTACVALSLDRVLLAPSRIPPHRTEPRASAFDRFAMVALATADDARLVPSDIEVQRPGVSYTVDTLDAIKAQAPNAEIVLIVGSDTFPEMASWREPERLFALCQIAVVTRPGNDVAGPDDPRVHRVPGAGLRISATEVRRRVAEGLEIDDLVGEGVARFVSKRDLYR